MALGSEGEEKRASNSLAREGGAPIVTSFVTYFCIQGSARPKPCEIKKEQVICYVRRHSVLKRNFSHKYRNSWLSSPPKPVFCDWGELNKQCRFWFSPWNTCTYFSKLRAEGLFSRKSLFIINKRKIVAELPSKLELDFSFFHFMSQAFCYY